MLLLHARDDRFTDFEGSQLLMRRAATSDKTLKQPVCTSDEAGGRSSQVKLS